jgi:membrane fusion protein (multidrug efflux system)
MIKTLLAAGVAASAIVATLVFIKLGQFGAMGDAAANMTLPPVTVTATTVSSAEWEQYISATASVTAVQGVIVSAEASGRVTDIRFDSDQSIDEGQVLVQLDTRTEKAQLASSRASAAQARADLKRLRSLSEKSAVSDDAVEQARTEVKEAEAQVEVIEAEIDKKTIHAPFSGRLGIRRVNQGQVLSVGDPIVALQKLDQVYIDFSVPQQKIRSLSRNMKVRVRSDATPDDVFHGEITAVALEVDPVTRNLQVRALVDNPEEKLRNGMFVNVELVLPESRKVLPVPATAVLYAPFGNSVFVIDEQKDEESGDTSKVLRQQFVVLGQARGDFVDVTDGLQDGETVVTSGVFKLQPGSQVKIDNSLAPEPSLTPQPRDS